ncbi:hypothetical protein [Streptomyces sp. NPDC059575]|uniref:hypothetical protein n=1 Tax=Streptomyces sp. NPDC059575 TaxID=3346872 RepID=UPI00367F2B74
MACGDRTAEKRARFASHVHPFPHKTALQYGFDGDALRFLTEVGIPSSEEWELPFGIAEDFDPDLVWDCTSRRERGWTFPGGVTRVELFDNLAGGVYT